MSSQPEYVKKYIDFLPSAFHAELKNGTAPFIEGYLKIFERILGGIDGGELGGKKGLETVLDIIAYIFHPRFSFLFDEPADAGTEKQFMPDLLDEHKKEFKKYFSVNMESFLEWLAGWMAFVLKDDLELNEKRKVISKIIPIYRMRGTKKGIQELLKIYIGADVEVYEELGTIQVGGSHVGVDTLIGGGAKPYFFVVKLQIPKADRKEITRAISNLKNLLDLEKPVHTSYLLKVSTPSLQIGNKGGSVIGKNTLIGGTFEEIET